MSAIARIIRSLNVDHRTPAEVRDMVADMLEATFRPTRTSERDAALDAGERQIRELLERMRNTENTRHLLTLLDEAEGVFRAHAELLKRGAR